LPTRGLHIGAFDGDKDRQRLFGQGDRGGDIAQSGVGVAQSTEANTLSTPPIPVLPSGAECLFVKLDGAPCLVQSGVRDAQIAVFGSKHTHGGDRGKLQTWDGSSHPTQVAQISLVPPLSCHRQTHCMGRRICHINGHLCERFCAKHREINVLVGTMPRTYEQTHPWLTFGLDLASFKYPLWMALGEASSKCEHIAGVPLAPAIAQRVHSLYLAKGASATTAIEGNTLSEEEAEQVIQGTLKLPPSQQYLAQELENIVEAVNTITNGIANNGASPLTISFLKTLNSMVLKDLEVDEGVVPGEIRQHRVMVRKYRCAPVEDCEFLLEKLCETLNEFPSPKGQESAFAIVKAVYAHLYFVWIHPFGDGNGRTARLIELYILLSAGFPQPTAHIMSNYYNRTRQKYYEALDAAIEGERKVIDFIAYSVTGFVEGLREQIDFIRAQQWKVAWVNYVHEIFHDKNSAAESRRRRLLLALTDKTEPVPLTKLTTLTPELTLEYHGKTPKTVVRDINALMAMELVTRRRGQISARREKILAFLPWRNVEAIKQEKEAD